MFYLYNRVLNELRRKCIKNLDKLNNKEFLNNLYKAPKIANKMFVNIIDICNKFDIKYDAFAKLLNIDVDNIKNI